MGAKETGWGEGVDPALDAVKPLKIAVAGVRA